jgi:hypothetical protein
MTTTMNAALDRLRTTSLAQRLVLGSAAAGFVVATRLWLGTGWVDPRVHLLHVGLASAWGACTAAFLLAGLGLFERLARRPRGLIGSSLPWQVTAWAGASVALAMAAQLTLEPDEDSIVYGLLAVVVAVLAWRRRHRRVATLPSILVPCAFVILGVQVPREHGVYSLHWNRVTTNASWSWQGSQNCNGAGLGDRPLAIAPYRPVPVIVPTVSGSFGELLSDALGRPPVDDLIRADIVTIDVGGHVEHGDLPCYLPIFGSETVQGTLNVRATFVTQGRGEELWSLQCSDHRSFSFTTDVASTGIASCRDLGIAAARAVAEQIRVHAREISGH